MGDERKELESNVKEMLDELKKSMGEETSDETSTKEEEKTENVETEKKDDKVLGYIDKALDGMNKLLFKSKEDEKEKTDSKEEETDSDDQEEEDEMEKSYDDYEDEDEMEKSYDDYEDEDEPKVKKTLDAGPILKGIDTNTRHIFKKLDKIDNIEKHVKTITSALAAQMEVNKAITSQMTGMVSRITSLANMPLGFRSMAVAETREKHAKGGAIDLKKLPPIEKSEWANAVQKAVDGKKITDEEACAIFDEGMIPVHKVAVVKEYKVS